MRYVKNRKNKFVNRLDMEDTEGGSKDHSQVSSLDYQMGMKIEYIENRIPAEDNFDLVYIHLEVPEGEKWSPQ